MKLNQIAFALVSTLGVVGAAQAQPVSDQSYAGTGYIFFNPLATNATVGVNGVSIQGVTEFEFPHLTAFGTDSNSVYSFISSTKFAAYPFIPQEHKQLGVWSFKNVSPQATDDVWFGEWYQENKDASGNPNGTVNAATHTVFYVGNDANTSVPSAGTATYSVTGLNNYISTGNVLSGTLTATFADQKLNGTLSGGTGATTSLALSNVEFNGSGAISTGAGSVTANGSISGDVSGQFFGNQATNTGSLAGIATFSDRQYDTAFGGAQTTYTP